MNELTEFIDVLLNHPTTTIYPSTSGGTPGCELINDELNISLNVYSDIDGIIYFQFNFILDKAKEHVEKEFPIFRTTLEESKTLLAKIFQQLDFMQNKEMPNASKFISAFRSFLRNEPLQDNFSIYETSDSYQLIEKNKVKSVHLLKRNIERIQESMHYKKEPTFLRSLTIASNNKKAYFYIPDFILQEYIFLKAPPKTDLENSTSNFNEVLDSLREFKDAKKSKIQDLLQYFELNKNLNKKDAVATKNKTKL